MQKIKAEIDNLGHDDTISWYKLEEKLKILTKEITNIPDLIEINNELINALGQKQSNLVNLLEEHKQTERMRDAYREQYLDLDNQIHKYKELAGLEQIKNKVLIDFIIKKKINIAVQSERQVRDNGSCD